MAALDFLGIGSNMQLGTLLDQLATAERLPLKALETQNTAYQAKLSGYGTIKSMLSAFQASANSLAKLDTFGAVKAQVSNSDVMTVATGANAIAGNYNVNVKSLAQAQSLAGAGQLKQDAIIGTGTLTFEFGVTGGYDADPASPTYGTYVNPTFTPTADSAKTVTIDSSNQTLQGIRDAINKANMGVKASIINDGSGTPYRLVLNSEKTGEAMSMRITGSSPELQALAGYDPVAGPQPGGMKEVVRATNAQLTINDIAITSASNVVTDAAQGVTMTLKKTGTTSMTLTQDLDSIKAAVQGLATAYNNLQSATKQLTAFDVKSGTKAALTGDGVLRGIQSTLRSVLNTPEAGMRDGAATTLAQLGVTLQKDGTMSVDTKKLDAALAGNLADVTALFGGDGTKGGIARRLSEAVDTMTGTNGPLTSATKGIEQSVKDLGKRYDSMSEHIDANIKRVQKQFQALDLAVSQMNRTKDYLTQQFSAMNNTNSK
ncbi:MAG: flagellar hook protein [Burkholderiaceae bacterium]|jgi:flagellar hook-associated protein 2|uniref:Flagellar hook-associated protein 2 n=1 Tax=Cupriavidus metallidurans TaxID=119219 RepID=A0A482J1X3_9BURK|nr:MULTISPECIES: flagellar filament capping protein FliD [Cupriavidus]KWR80680.1 flagellar hook protein [Cupriavidus sp. SHE]PCH58658.1 MAG: flagellar hook protein [Burkholderiaceae bacterium]QBP13923.1 flagellar hook protein [Cupriavidus metallidurans]QWC91704.1 flagellar filament capping protein FliD [Cupriavidus metallidurans]